MAGIVTSAETAASEGKPSILIVDDQRAVREQLLRLCTPLSDRIELAADGVECLESLRHHRPDLLLLDLFMPRSDGLSVLDELKRHPGLRPRCVVVMSGLDDEFVVNRILKQGADGFIHKPFSENILRDIFGRLSPNLPSQVP